MISYQVERFGAPAAAWTVSRYRPHSSEHHYHDARFDSVWTHFDASSTVRLRSSSHHSPDGVARRLFSSAHHHVS